MPTVTFNPVAKSSNITLSNGNLTASCSTSSNNEFISTSSFISGKLYWEITVTSRTAGYVFVGIDRFSLSSSYWVSRYPGYTAGSYGWGNGTTSNLYSNGGAGVAHGTYAVLNDVIMIALDLDNGLMWFGKNGTWFSTGGNAGNPAAGTYPSASGIAPGSYNLACALYSTIGITANFGATAFTYSAPSGFTSPNSNSDALTIDKQESTVYTGFLAYLNYKLTLVGVDRVRFNGINFDGTVEGTYEMRGWDTGSGGRFVRWFSDNPTITPISTQPTLTGSLTNIQIIKKID